MPPRPGGAVEVSSKGVDHPQHAPGRSFLSTQHVVSLVLAALAAACELLAAFGRVEIAGVALLPLGLLFLIASWAVCHTHHHP